MERARELWQIGPSLVFAVRPRWVPSMDGSVRFLRKSESENGVAAVRADSVLCREGSNCVQCGEPKLLESITGGNVLVSCTNDSYTSRWNNCANPLCAKQPRNGSSIYRPSCRYRNEQCV